MPTDCCRTSVIDAPLSRRRRLRRARRIAIATLSIVAAAADAQPAANAQPPAEPPTWHVPARVVAVGLPGVAGVRQIGRFHTGGPIPGNPEFLLQTDPGRVLDPRRLMVAVAANFGAPPSASGGAPGAILSIDPRGPRPLVVPRDFAARGGQAVAADGAIQLYSAQSPPFLNARFNAGARTAAQAATAGPRYVSVNNAFGRPWIANAPFGVAGAGSLSVLDPDGAPLANAPSDDAGGVFLGQATARRQVPKGIASTLLGKAFNYRDSGQLTAGAIGQGALGTAFLGASPDGSGLAVFAVATADGAIAQVHVQDGVDGLAPAGSVKRGDDDGGVIGMAFQWSPERVLYVADAGRDRVLLLHLRDDRRQFVVERTSTIASSRMHQPVDLAPAVPEVGNAGFASHTSFAGSSDFYVANRGDGSLLRIDARGRVVARLVIDLPGGAALGPGRLRALAVSGDAQRIWLTLQGELPGFAGQEGALIEVSAFDRAGAFLAADRAADPRVEARADDAAPDAGALAFARVFDPDGGLGPLFNERSCAACHPGGGASVSEEHFARRIAHMDEATGRVSAVDHPNSPIARRRSTQELGHADAPAASLPRQANVVSLRMPIGLFTAAAIDRVADASIEAQAVSKGDGIKGRVARVAGAGGETRLGRWGWKADIAALDEMVADAFANELGITSALAARPVAAPRDDGRLVRAVAAYLRRLQTPAAGSP